MSPNLSIAFRFLTARKRAMLMSLSCTILGVGLFIVTQATTTGFEEFFIKTVLGTDGAIRIEDKLQDTIVSMTAGRGSNFEVSQRDARRYIEGVEEPRLVIDALRQFPAVSGISAVLRGNVQVRSSFKNESAQVFGVDLDQHVKVSDLARQITDGSLEAFRESPAAVIVGRVLADRLQLNVGDSFIIASGQEARRYHVGAIFETGVRDMDKTRIYLDLGEARSLLHRATGVTFIQVNLHNPDRAPEEAAHMEEVIGYSVKPWQEREKTWLSVFYALRVSTSITVSVFTLIASLAMFNTLAMVVIEKTKDIAILRSMGYERRDVTQIFLWLAAVVLCIGTIGGSLFGAAVTFAVSRMPIQVSGIFATNRFLVAWSWVHYAEAIATAIVMVMIASVIPARRAARLEPGDIVRGTAQ